MVNGDDISPRRSRVGQNAAVGAAVQMIVLVFGLLTAPVMLSSLGPELFGAYAVLSSLTAYAGLFDFGIGSSLIRFMSIYQERGDKLSVDRVMTFGFVFYIIFGAFALYFAFINSGTLFSFLGFPTRMLSEFGGLIAATFGIWGFLLVMSIFSARLNSLHRLDIVALCSLFGTIVYVVVILFFLPEKPTIWLVIMASFLQISVTSALQIIALFCIEKRRPFSFRWMPWSEIKQLWNFGVWVQISGVTAVVNLEADKVIIGHSLGVSEVTPYQFANRIALLSRMLPLQILSALLPDVTARLSRSSDANLRVEVYRRSTRTLMLTTLMISGFVICSVDTLLRFWLGRDLEGAAELSVALVISYAINNATGAGSTIVKADGKPQFETLYGVLSAVINISATMILIKDFGLYGVVAGTILGNVIGSAFFIALFHRVWNISWCQSVGSWLWKLLIMTLSAGVFARLILFQLLPDGHGRIGMIGPLIASGISYLIVMFVAGRILKFWDDEDSVVFSRLLTSLRLCMARR